MTTKNKLVGIDDINLGVVVERDNNEEIKVATDADYSRCPVCESACVEYGGCDTDSVFVYRVHKCTDCGCEWEERYDLVRVKIKTSYCKED